MDKKDEQVKEEKQPQTQKKHFSLSVEERILFAIVLILLGCIILVHSINTADFTPVVQYVEPTNSQSDSPASLEPGKPTSSATSDTANEIININTASLEQLMSLNGIGQTKAQAILDYRAQIGRFNSVDELLEVKGIGENTLEKIRDRLTVE